jgi:hypothetical protein
MIGFFAAKEDKLAKCWGYGNIGFEDNFALASLRLSGKNFQQWHCGLLAEGFGALFRHGGECCSKDHPYRYGLLLCGD